MDILKDADATAIYGTKAANGVVLITTKKGKSRQNKTGCKCIQGRRKSCQVYSVDEY